MRLATRRSNLTRYTIVLDGKVIGFIQATENLDPQYRHAGIDIFLGPPWHRQGLGFE